MAGPSVLTESFEQMDISRDHKVSEGEYLFYHFCLQSQVFLELSSDADCFVRTCREEDLCRSTVLRERGLRRSRFQCPIKAREGMSDSGHETLSLKE